MLLRTYPRHHLIQLQVLYQVQVLLQKTKKYLNEIYGYNNFSWMSQIEA